MKLSKKLAILVFALATVFLNFEATDARAAETFDIISFKTPKGWAKKPAPSAIQFSKQHTAKGTYCLITLYKSVPATPNAKKNFEMAWTSLVKEMVTVSAAPKMEPTATEDGWKTQSGYAAFESSGTKGIVVLVTSSGFGKMVNLVILTNTDAYEKEIGGFLASLSLKKPKVATQSRQTPAAADDKNPIIGTWAMSASDQSDYQVKNGINGYVKRQYTFNGNGTYSFFIKTFSYTSNKLLLTKENGTYHISGDILTINPQKSVIEAWSKKDAVDKWGNLLSSQKRNLEKTNYRFTKHYFSGIQLWNLVLQADQATEREGPFSSNTTFSNAWYYAPISANNTAIELPKSAQSNQKSSRSEPRATGKAQ